MPFLFTWVCELLQSLENDINRRRGKRGEQAIVDDWFARYRRELDDDLTDKCALLSTLLIERRTDRVFGIKEKTLQPKIARACGLGPSRLKELSRWTVPGSDLDLAECAEAILEQTPNVRNPVVTVEEIDGLLHALAAKNSFSAPSVRASGKPSTEAPSSKHDEPLETLFRRLSAREAKWATRLILKSYLPVIVPERLVYARCHRLLPTIMKIHDDFTVATRLLEQGRSRVTFGEIEIEDLPRLLKPQIGVKVGRQTWIKGRSIKHCLEMGKGFMSVEEKMDGEYCQIHVDLSKGSNCIQIFSKSGKDSTQDKKRLHSAIKSSLGLGTPSCKIKHCCILEGEVVVYSDREQRILSFDKLRKHISRSGRYIGNNEDSQAHDWEHLMVVYYDILRVDDESLLNVRHSARFSRLSKLVQCQTGRAALVQRQIINFSSRVAAEDLKAAFASSIVRRDEGLVLKPDEPYFSFGRSKRRYASCCVKLKKGYIKGMGEVGDLAVVSGRYCPTRAKMLKMPTAKYTHFYLGCLTNKEAIERWGAKPEFTIVNEVEVSATMMDTLRRTWFTETVPLGHDKAPILSVTAGISQGRKITMAFTQPAVFEMTCFSFHKESNTAFWSLRFPYVSKIHSDRTFKDCLTFQELQSLAEEEVNRPEEEDSQELTHWIEALERAEPKKRKAALQESQWSETAGSTSESQTRTPQSDDEQSPIRPAHTGTIADSAVRAGLPTPPTSSAVQMGSSPAERRLTRQSPRKRHIESLSGSPRPVKSRRKETEIIDLTSPTLSNSQRSQRQPLEDITSAPSSQVNVPTPTGGDAKDITSPIVPPPPASPTLANRSSDRNQRSSAASCEYAGGICALANAHVLLSPCIANMPLLTEDLLPAHGVSRVFTDVPSWVDSLQAAQTGATRRRPRRLVLVERHRSEATSAFLREIEARPLRGRSGRAEVVLAYDWRLLEAITEEERRHLRGGDGGTRQTRRTGANGEELWRKYYFGCIDGARDG
ncbi:ATP dependent DNA ligase domain-containing protein [Diaporthe helianthi]|uniref:ATP dependent DNA ligase domain-containing protein n=1 Tax=Diaporthe helianthi TaxID=158607 RepID=A0A2P5IDL1_DIAHE|nr:ATP dependent DNA ligase domain-containing protein [Diaporthe helianthi]